MTRRTFLGLTFVTAATLTAGSFPFFNRNERFSTFLEKNLHWLTFNSDVIEKFQEDYFQYQCTTFLCQLKFSIFLVLEDTPLFNKVLSKQRDHSRELLLSQLLLSTDFFKNSMNENRTIQYSLYYDPYINLCNNLYSTNKHNTPKS